MLGNVYRRIAALPLVLKVLLAVAALIAVGILVVASPLVVVVAFLVLIVAILALIYRVLRRRPLRNWGFIALASLLLLILFGGITNALYGGGALQQASSPSEPKEEEAKPAPPETTTESTTEPTPTPSEPKENAQDEPEYDATTRVTRVVDGDTIRISPAVDGKDEVRLIGVDTPETKEPGCEVQPYGPEASQFATSELQGEEVGLEFDQEREDRYDRLLAYVYLEDEMFNERLLEEGYAQVYIVEPNDRYEDRFEEAQDEAQTAERGIWALSASEQDQLTDRGNGIGGDGCIREEPTPTPPPQPEPSLDPEPTPDPDPVPSTPRPETPSAPTPPSRSNGADCSTGVKNVPVVPGSKGDRDKDGIACET